MYVIYLLKNVLVEEFLHEKATLKNQKENETPHGSGPSCSKLPTFKKLKLKLFKKKVHESHVDAFDQLLASKSTQNSLRVNKGGQKRSYFRKKKEKIKNREELELLDFENVKNKESVQSWLNDTRNNFNRLTQTQDSSNGAQYNTTLVPENLPSVSQRKTLDDFIKPVKIMRKIRSKSVDLELKSSSTKKHPDHHSEVIDNYSIEDINSEEKIVKKAEANVLLHLIEDNFLDKLDTELVSPVKKNKTQKKSDSPGKDILNSSATSITGWKRVSVMKKNMKVYLKEPKSLKIVLETSLNNAIVEKERMEISTKEVQDEILDEVKL